MRLELLSIGFSLLASGYVAIYYCLNLVMVFFAFGEVRRQRQYRLRLLRQAAVDSGEMPGISVLIPAYNEETSIVHTVESVLDSHYPDFEVIVVNDGATDRTLGMLWRKFQLAPSNDPVEPALPTQNVRAVFVSRLNPRLKVVDKRNGGKADALNVAINASNKELVCAIDADVLLGPTSLFELAVPFAEDPSTVASSGIIRPRNGCLIREHTVERTGLPHSWLERFQVLEYIRSFGIGRLFFNRLNAHLIISGAFGLFRRRLLIEVGGYQPHAIGEDMELVVRLHQLLRKRGEPYRIVLETGALCLTEAPYSIRDLGKQRTRWHQGLLTTLRLHRDMFLKPKYGAVGLIAFPYFFLFELLSPFVETAGWMVIPILWALGWLPLGAFALFLGVSILLSSLVSLEAIILDTTLFNFHSSLSQRARLILVALLEPFGYHQLNLFFRLRAFPRYYGAIHIKGGWKSPARIFQVQSKRGSAARRY